MEKGFRLKGNDETIVEVRKGKGNVKGRLCKSYILCDPSDPDNEVPKNITHDQVEACKREVEFFIAHQSCETENPPICKIKNVYCDEEYGMIYLELKDIGKTFFDEFARKFQPITDDTESIIKSAKTLPVQSEIVQVRRGTDGLIYKSYSLVTKYPTQQDVDSCKREVAFFEAQQSCKESMPIGKIYGAYCGSGRYDNMIFLAMEDCGTELDVAKPLPVKEVKTKFKKALEGVEFMHNTLKFCHYDIKPENIGGTEGKLFDFGECVATSRRLKDGSLTDKCGHDKHTETHTPHAYAARPHERTKTADLFAMGVTLLEMLCGEISEPQCNDGKHAYGWKLFVESNDVWKAKWYVAELKNGKPVASDVETSLRIPACPKAKDLVKSLLVDSKPLNGRHPSFQAS